MSRRAIWSRAAWIGTVGVVLVAASIQPIRAQHIIIDPVIPDVFETTPDGKRQKVAREDLDIGIELFQRFARKDAPEEMFVLEDWTCGDGRNYLAEFLLYAKRAEVRYYPDDCRDRYFHRKLDAQEAAALRKFMSKKKVDQLPDWDEEKSGVFDGSEYRYWHFTKESGYRLSMNNPPEDPKDREYLKLPPDHPSLVYGDLVRELKRILAIEKLRVKYPCSEVYPQLEVVFAHPEKYVSGAWAKGSDIRVLVGYRHCDHEWRSVRNGRLGDPIDAPEGYPTRALQPASEPGVVWKAERTKESRATWVGRYDTKTSCFRNQLSIPLAIRSADLWVDQPARKIYFVFKGHLLCIPLPDR